MPTRRDFDHIGNFHFKVHIPGGPEVVFQEVSGLEVITEVVEFQDGEDLTLRKRPGRTSFSNIVLKRGYTANDALWTWMKTVIDGKVERHAGSLILFGDDAETEVATYNFFEAWPCRWKGFNLDGKGIGAAIEELEIVVERVEKSQ